MYHVNIHLNKGTTKVNQLLSMRSPYKYKLNSELGARIITFSNITLLHERWEFWGQIQVGHAARHERTNGQTGRCQRRYWILRKSQEGRFKGAIYRNKGWFKPSWQGQGSGRVFFFLSKLNESQRHIPIGSHLT